ncbi:MAG: hypothetical protein R2991_14945 [Thermoanaerobaculia bacterium]
MRSTKSPSWSSPLLARLLGAEPVAAPPDAFSLAPDALRWARFRRQPSGYEFDGFAEVGLADDLFPGGPLGGPAAETAPLRAALAELLDGVGGGVASASLVLPDAWLRVAFTEFEEEPRGRKERLQVLSWKMQRLVPVRVDDLRLRAAEAPTLGGNGVARYLVLFALEALLAQLEGLFAEAGVTLGRIVPESLAVAAALEGPSEEEATTGLVMVSPEGYSLTFLRAGEPLLHRYRALAGAGAADRLVLRDLRMTQTFLEERAPGAEPSRVLLLAPEESVMSWVQRLVEGLGRPVHALGREQLPLRGQLRHGDLSVVAPLLGAVCQEVA